MPYGRRRPEHSGLQHITHSELQETPRQILRQPRTELQPSIAHDRLEERKARIADRTLALEEGDQPLGLAIGQEQRVVDKRLAALVFPDPGVRVAIQHAWAALDFDDEEAAGGQHQQVNFIDAAVVRNELEVRPRVVRLLVREALPNVVEGVLLPRVGGLSGRVPTARDRGIAFGCRAYVPTTLLSKSSRSCRLVMARALLRRTAGRLD